MLKFCVTLKQVNKRSYFDEDKKEIVEYDDGQEINGVFFAWNQVMTFTNMALDAFENATIKIEVESEADKDGVEL